MLVRMENKEKQGLGLPLPSGGIALFETVSGADVLVGQDNLRDHAIGEEVEAQLGDSAQLQYRLERSEEHTSELQSLMRISYAVFCLKKKKYNKYSKNTKIIYIKESTADANYSMNH